MCRAQEQGGGEMAWSTRDEMGWSVQEQQAQGQGRDEVPQSSTHRTGRARDAPGRPTRGMVGMRYTEHRACGS